MADDETPPEPIDHRAEALRLLGLAQSSTESREGPLTLTALTYAALSLADEVRDLLPVLAGDGTPLITTQAL